MMELESSGFRGPTAFIVSALLIWEAYEIHITEVISFKQHNSEISVFTPVFNNWQLAL